MLSVCVQPVQRSQCGSASSRCSEASSAAVATSHASHRAHSHTLGSAPPPPAGCAVANDAPVTAGCDPTRCL
jgi:hypothetical protein